MMRRLLRLLLAALLLSQLPASPAHADTPAPLRQLSYVNGAVRAVAASGDYAYALAGRRLTVLSIVDGMRPVGQLEDPDFAAVGSIDALPGVVLLGPVGPQDFRSDSISYVIDVRDPGAPRRVGAVGGGTIATGSGTQISSITSGYFDSGTLYVSDYADPTAPRALGTLVLSSDRFFGFSAMVANGPYRYIVRSSARNQSSDLLVVELQNPAAPRLVRTIPIPGGVQITELTLVGRWLYALPPPTATPNTVLLFDMAAPAKPTYVAQVTFKPSGTPSARLKHIASDGARLLAVFTDDPNRRSDLLAYDVTQPRGPVSGAQLTGLRGPLDRPISSGPIILLTSAAIPGDVIALRWTGSTLTQEPGYGARVPKTGLLALQGNTLYTAVGSGLFAIDVEHPQVPRLLGATDDWYNAAIQLNTIGLNPETVYVTDSACFVGCGSLRAASIADPIRRVPRQLVRIPPEPSYNTLGCPLLAVTATRLYDTCYAGVRERDITQPFTPTLRSSYSLAPALAALALTVDPTGQAIVATQIDLRAVSFAAGTATEHAVFTPLTLGTVLAATFDEGYAYLVSATALRVVDVRNPLAMRDRGTLAVPISDVPKALRVSQGMLYLLQGYRLLVFDVRDPDAPRLLTEQGVSLGLGRDLAVAGRNIYLSDQLLGLTTLWNGAALAASIPPSGGALDAPADRRRFSFASGSFGSTATVTQSVTLTTDLTGLGARLAVGTGFTLSADAALTQPYTLTVRLGADQPGPVISGTLALYRASGGTWVREPTSRYDPASRTLTATPSSLGTFALLGETRRTWLPTIR